MPSASNSPMTPRRRRSRISTLAQSLQQKRSVVAAANNEEEAANAAAEQEIFEKSPSPVMEKFRQQLSVASMVQRFERDGSTERARSRDSIQCT